MSLAFTISTKAGTDRGSFRIGFKASSACLIASVSGWVRAVRRPAIDVASAESEVILIRLIDGWFNLLDQVGTLASEG